MRRILGPRGIFLLVTVGLIFNNAECVAQTTTESSEHWNKLLKGEEVFDAFQKSDTGQASVIVNLVRPEALASMDWKSEEARKSNRKALLAHQQSVLDAIPEARIREQFENQPGFSAEVSPDALERLLKDPRVESVQPVRVMKKHLRQGLPLINAMGSRSTYNGSGVSVAICDDGVDYRHPFLGNGGFPNSKVIGGFNFGDGNSNPLPIAGGHGTSCAGIAAGNIGNVGDYIGGVAPNAKIYALKVSAGTLDITTDDKMIAAWNWCVTHQNDDPANPILVVSCSVGEGRYFAACDSDLTAFRDAANNLANAGITLVCSSGNDGYCDSISAPACLSGAVSVGAVFDSSFGGFNFCVDPTSCAPKVSTTACDTRFQAQVTTAPDSVTPYCNISSRLSVLAPAEEAYTLDVMGASGETGTDYNPSFGGTSAACPYVAGAIAALQSAAHATSGRYLTPAEIRSKLTTYGDFITDSKSGISKPRVNLGSMMSSLGGPGPVTLQNPVGGQTLSAGSTPQFSWQQNGNAASWYYIWINRGRSKYLDTWTQNTTYTPANPLPGGDYSWWVRPWNSGAFGDWTSTGQFTIQSCIPGSPGQVAPQATVNPSPSQTYNWNAESCATWYELAIGHGGGIFLDHWYQPSDLTSQGGQLSISIDGHTGGTYTWWVRGWSSDDMGPWSGPATFQIPPPGTVSLLSPADNSTVLSATPLTLSWSASNPSALWYWVWVSRGNAMYLSQWTQDTSLSLPNGVPSGTYTWWVEPWNFQGLGAWSSAGHFTAQ
jgi:subtilisin family serine protease